MKRSTFCTLVYIIIIMLFATVYSFGQSTKTFAKPLALENLSQLNVKLNGTVEYISTNSQRITVETTVIVKHSTRDAVIMDYIAAKGLATIKTTVDNNNDTISIIAPTIGNIVVNGEAAQIITSYKVYVPKTMNLL